MKSQTGFSLVEVIIAIVMLSIILLMLPSAGIAFSRSLVYNRVRNEAGSLADAWIAWCREEPNYIALDSTTNEHCRYNETNLGSQQFTRNVIVVNDASLSGVADSLNDYKRITVTITGGGLLTPVQRTITIAK